MTYKEGNAPTRIAVTVQDQDSAAINVSSATTKEIRVKPPGGAVEALTASFDGVLGTGDGTDGKIYADYATALRPGTYSYEAHVVLPSGEWYTEAGTFEVSANL